MSDMETENQRFITLSTLNIDSHIAALLPLNLSLGQDSTFSDANQQINDRIMYSGTQGTQDITLLMQIFGPRPSWRFPAGNEKIPQTTRTLYLVDRSKHFLIALLRTEKGDRPLLIDSGHQTGPAAARTIRSILKSTISAQGLNMVSARMYDGSKELKNQRFNHSTLENHPTYPTTFYISCIHANNPLTFKSNPVVSRPIAAPFQITFLRCKRLVKSVLEYPIMSMQCVHISQALLHLIVSLIDTGQNELEDILINHEIRGIADSFEINASRLTGIDIDEADIQTIVCAFESNFLACCGDFPGATVVRHSYEVYLNIVESDLQDLNYEKQKIVHTTLRKTKMGLQLPVNRASRRASSCSRRQTLSPASMSEVEDNTMEYSSISPLTSLDKLPVEQGVDSGKRVSEEETTAGGSLHNLRSGVFLSGGAKRRKVEPKVPGEQVNIKSGFQKSRGSSQTRHSGLGDALSSGLLSSGVEQGNMNNRANSNSRLFWYGTAEMSPPDIQEMVTNPTFVSPPYPPYPGYPPVASPSFLSEPSTSLVEASSMDHLNEGYRVALRTASRHPQADPIYIYHLQDLLYGLQEQGNTPQRPSTTQMKPFFRRHPPARSSGRGSRGGYIDHKCLWPGCDFKHTLQKCIDHFFSRHVTVKFFLCGVDDCKKKFLRQHDLYRHKYNVHNIPKPRDHRILELVNPY